MDNKTETPDASQLEAWNNVLTKRAKELSKPISLTKDAMTNEDIYLMFSLKIGNFAIKIDYVSEVIQIKNFTIVPCTPPHIYGIIRLRGQVISLVDIVNFIQQKSGGIADSDYAIIATVDGLTFGIVTSSIKDVTTINTAEIKPPPQNFNNAIAKYSHGVLPDWRIILNLKAIVRQKGFVLSNNKKA